MISIKLPMTPSIINILWVSWLPNVIGFVVVVVVSKRDTVVDDDDDDWVVVAICVYMVDASTPTQVNKANSNNPPTNPNKLP